MVCENVHGGTDALGIPAHDFSTNRNACGPCPAAVEALQAAHAAQYPDPHYTALRHTLAQFHGVAVERVLLGGSASELIYRWTLHAVRQGACGVSFPPHCYGDYPQAAALWPLAVLDRQHAVHGPGLHWACEPSSPVGQSDPVLAAWQTPAPPQTWRVLDRAYAPLQLEPEADTAVLDHVWQLWTPNKALGMTGVRAAYAIAPREVTPAQMQALQRLAPSWVVGAHGVAMLHAWCQPEVQAWLEGSKLHLRAWKAALIERCAAMGWEVLPGHRANYVVARWPLRWQGTAMEHALQLWRAQGIKLRDARSFGLPGCVRLGVLPPASQAVLQQAWTEWEARKP